MSTLSICLRGLVDRVEVAPLYGDLPAPLWMVHPVDLGPRVEDRLSLGLALDLGLDLDHLPLGIGLELHNLGLDLDYPVPDPYMPVPMTTVWPIQSAGLATVALLGRSLASGHLTPRQAAHYLAPIRLRPP